jgi:hypothetical protein
MANSYEKWLNDVRAALESINMGFDDWQNIWPFDFQHEFNAGVKAEDAAMKASRFWWREQKMHDCGCWLLPTYKRGDYVKVEFPDENTGVGELIWVRVSRCDDQKQLVFGRLDNEPLNDYNGKVGLGSEVAVSFSQIREHRKPAEFTSR